MHYLSGMKTTMELPDDLFKAMKVRAAMEGRSLKDLLTEILRQALQGKPATSSKRAKAALPIVDCPPARKGKELTPERLAEVLYGSGE